MGEPGRRQTLLSVASLLLLGVFVARLVDVQLVNAAPLAEEALAQRLVTVEVTPPRGDIVDRNGVVLATSVERYDVAVDQVTLAKWQRTDDGTVVAEGPFDAAQILAPILGLNESELAADLVGDKTFQYLAKNVTAEQLELVRAERIHGITWDAVSERLYPNGDIAGNVIGFMAEDGESTDAVGMAGVELLYEDELTGTAGSQTYEKSRYGTMIPTGLHSETPAVDGWTVMLTLDRDIQYFTEQALEKALAKYGARAGSIVVMDSRTGEILALADSGSVDPRDPGATPANQRGSRAVSTVFEPGSTAKTITMAAALEEGIATPTSEFVAPYEYETPYRTFRDSHPHPDQKLTLAGILVNSSNTGTIQVGQQMSDETRYKYMRAFGLGEPTNMGLPDESSGILHPYEDWDGITRYATMYGQGVAVTGVQTVQVYGVIANEGLRISPTIVKGFEAADGTVTARENAEPVRVVSEDTAKAIMGMLVEVTEDGTAPQARIDGYLVAGKTGTAQAPDENGELTKLVTSFVGIAPADDPRIVVSVVLYDPTSSIWGGTTAAPVFKDVATFALQTLRVPPTKGEVTRYPTTWE
ncbi:penicillin-binding protein 2 [Demequina sp.]|uniref:peptidoglycan D,D-transpeptidase FtsI family protein n=1 Tax=Demequina sp. TaxID=2050685 RepID=UPI0025BBB021|nr:penicillin-binding protein 2 [Demequina sp.]